MSDDRVYMTISGADAAEFFDRFEAVAQRFGFVREPVSRSISEEPQTRLNPTEFGPYHNQTPEPELPEPETRLLKKRRGRPAKPPASTLDELAESSIDPPAAPEPAEPAPAPTMEDVKLAGARLIQRHNGSPAALRALLSQYGLTKLKPLPEDKWPEFIELCDHGTFDKEELDDDIGF